MSALWSTCGGPLLCSEHCPKGDQEKEKREEEEQSKEGKQQLICQALPVAEVDYSSIAAHLGGPESPERRAILTAAQALRNVSLMSLPERRRENVYTCTSENGVFRSHPSFLLTLQQQSWLSMNRFPNWRRIGCWTLSVESKPLDHDLKHGQLKGHKTLTVGSLMKKMCTGRREKNNIYWILAFQAFCYLTSYT